MSAFTEGSPRWPRPVAAAALAAAALLQTPALLAQEPAATEGPVTWGVVPSTANGPDGRAAYDLQLDPGGTRTDYVGVSNLSEQPLELAVYASDAFTTEGGGFDLLPADEDPTDVGSWVTFDQPTVVVPARSRLDIPFRLDVPTNATPGDHPGGIVASLRTPGSEADGGQVAVDRRVGARIYLRVAGDLEPQLTVDEVRITPHPSLHPARAGSATVGYRVRNTGNVRLDGEVALRIAGPFGLAARTTRLDDLPELLPGDELDLSTEIEGVASLGRVTATVTVDPRDPTDGTEPPSARASSSSWALPFVHLGIAGLLASVVLLRRKRRRHARARHEAELAAARAEGALVTTP